MAGAEKAAGRDCRQVSVRTIAAADAIARLEAFDSVIDARSEAEYAEDHLPGALNWPPIWIT